MAGISAGQGQLGWDDGPAGTDTAPWLTAIDPAAWSVAPDWQATVDAFWRSKDGCHLLHYLSGRMKAAALIYPPIPLRALALTPLAAVRVVILGQDPYHGPGQAEGLAFSVAPGIKIPPSLRNIFKELQRDLGLPVPPNGSLVRWATQGVLLLNDCLTVEDGLPASHAGQGWTCLTDAVIQRCSDEGGPKVFVLWGSHAQKKVACIDSSRHLVLSANHPSPLSASRGTTPFLGCGHFSAVNRWLTETRMTTISW